MRNPVHALALGIAVAAATLGAAACGSSSSSTTPTTATMNVHLVDSPTTTYRAVNVDVQTVEILSGSTWTVLGTPSVVVNLLSLTGGVTQTLVNGATLPPGTYGQMRLVLGSRNTVVDANGVTHDLKVPSGQQSGVKMPIAFTVQAGTTSDVFIDFDARNSVFVHPAGNSQQYILRPVVSCYDRVQTGSVSGVLTERGAGTPLAGVTVMAETLASEVPSVSRSTVTNASGAFLLDLLPVGSTYFVVAQPVVPAAGATPAISYAAQASEGFALSVATPTATWNGVFDRATATGDVGGSITPAAVTSPTLTETDTVELRATVSSAGTPHPFVVRVTPADVAAGGETWGMTLLPVTAPSTTYSAIATRRTVDSSGAETSRSSAAVPVGVPAGGSATANLVFSP